MAGEHGAPGSTGMGAGQRLRIIHVFRAPLGGLFRHVLDITRGQIERGHAVGIFCDAETGGTRATEVLDALAPDLELGLHRIPMRRPPHALDALALLKLDRLVARQRPDVLHGHGSKGGAFSRAPMWSARGARHPITAYTPHGGSFNYNPGSFAHRCYMGIERYLSGRTDAFLFESGYVRDRFEAFIGPTSRLVRIVHNGIAEAEFEPVSRVSDPYDLLYIGELRPAKGIETLIDALALVRKRDGRRLTLLVVGSGPSLDDLQARTRANGTWDSVAFLPPQPIRSVLSRGRVMIIPSRAESLPYVILEAAAACQPMISTNVGGIGEIFGPFADQLIPPDDPVRLADVILARMTESEAARTGRAEALSRYVHQGFRIDTMVEDGIAAYRDALALAGRGPPRAAVLPLAAEARPRKAAAAS